MATIAGRLFTFACGFHVHCHPVHCIPRTVVRRLCSGGRITGEVPLLSWRQSTCMVCASGIDSIQFMEVRIYRLFNVWQGSSLLRSEERRVGKECRSRWLQEH